MIELTDFFSIGRLFIHMIEDVVVLLMEKSTAVHFALTKTFISPPLKQRDDRSKALQISMRLIFAFS